MISAPCHVLLQHRHGCYFITKNQTWQKFAGTWTLLINLARMWTTESDRLGSNWFSKVSYILKKYYRPNLLLLGVRAETHMVVRDGDKLSVIINVKPWVISALTLKATGPVLATEALAEWINCIPSSTLISTSVLGFNMIHCNEYNWAQLWCSSIIHNQPELWSNVLNTVCSLELLLH